MDKYGNVVLTSYRNLPRPDVATGRVAGKVAGLLPFTGSDELMTTGIARLASEAVGVRGAAAVLGSPVVGVAIWFFMTPETAYSE